MAASLLFVSENPNDVGATTASRGQQGIGRSAERAAEVLDQDHEVQRVRWRARESEALVEAGGSLVST